MKNLGEPKATVNVKYHISSGLLPKSLPDRSKEATENTGPSSFMDTASVLGLTEDYWASSSFNFARALDSAVLKG